MTNPYETVTARIIESLKAGVIPWAKPWKGTGSNDPFPRNFRTGTPYRGANILILWASAYTSQYWLTFKQAQELGGAVRKGEKGTQILFWKIGKRDAKATKPTEIEAKDDKERKSFFCRAYTVFNVEQCDGLKVPATVSKLPEVPQDERCEAIVTGWADRPRLELDNAHEGRAYYRPRTDTVHMPTRNRFVDAPHYYATLFHELIHSTGHENRLNRTFGATFGDDLYSKEELVAEVGSSFLCAIAAISNERTEQNSTAYIQHWIEALQGDSRLIITAASAAQRAADAIVAGKCGKSQSHIYARLALLQLVPEVAEAFQHEKITASHANLIARLPQNSQAAAFEQCWRKEYGQPEPHLLPAKHLAAWITSHLYLALEDAPFDREDPTLSPEAGACITCPRRTGYNTTLFADVADQGDQCLDSGYRQMRPAPSLQPRKGRQERHQGRMLYLLQPL